MGGGWDGDPVATGEDPYFLKERPMSGWHGDPDHSGFDPDIQSHENRFKGGIPDVKEFQGEHRFLSNFCPAKVVHDGIEYPTTEHAFQAAKTLDFHERWEISQLETPGQAKRRGRKVQIRPDWEQVKEQVMMELTILKFVNHRPLREALLATGEAKLIEGNNWGDTYWGVCNGEGQNMLGKILMIVRDQLR